MLIAGLVVVAGCGEVRNAELDAARTDASQADPVDAGTDAGAVACQTNDDCGSPPDGCHLAGSCNGDHQCEFPAVDCSAMDSECTTGVCEGGTCIARAIAEGQPCGPGTTCGDFGPCAGFDPADPCDETGQHVRSCQDSTCTAGACVAGASYDDPEVCMRDREGVTCRSDSTSCSSCTFAFGDQCTEQGARACTTKSYSCQNAVCTESSSTTSETCTRNTDGDLCDTQSCPGGGVKSVCCSGGTCSADCGGCL